eukprot:UN27557
MKTLKIWSNESLFLIIFPSYVKLLLFEVVIWLVKANCLFLIVLLSLKERKNMKILQKSTLFLQKQSKSLKNHFFLSLQ